MKFSSLTSRIAGEHVDAWAVHYRALARKESGDDIILLSVGQDGDAFTPAPIVDAAVQSLRAGRHHYTAVNGNLNLRQAVARRHNELTGRAIDESHCAIFAGAQNALFAVAQCLLESGDEVIAVEPYYTTYPATFTAAGAKLISVPMQPDFQLNPDAVTAAITPRTRLIVLNSPNNPLGAVYSQQQYARIVAACAAQNIWLLLDDVYQELLHADERANPFALPDAARVCISVSSVSKSHNMTGWRLGWAIAPPALTAHLYNLAMCLSYGLPAFIQDAAVAALASGNAEAMATRAKLDARRTVVLDALRGVAGLRLFGGDGGMFIVLDIGELKLSARDFADELLARYDVAILPCDGFGESEVCKRLLRMSLCASETRLAEACRRIAELAGGITL